MAAFFDGLVASVNAACTLTLGFPIAYQPQETGSAAYTINAIPNDQTELDDTAFGVSILLSVNYSDFQSIPVRGDQVTLPSGDVYEVQDIDTDVQGMTVLNLLKSRNPNATTPDD